MRPLTCSLLLVAACAPPASAQVQRRVEVGAIVRQDHVSFEGDASGSNQVTGVAVNVAITKQSGIAAEFTSARHETSRSYEGYFLSYAPAPSTQAEIERLGVYARRTLTYSPGFGTALAYVLRGDPDVRIDTVLKLGVSFRQYVETSDITILRVPDGIDPSRPAATLTDARRDRIRAGLSIAFAVPMVVTRQLIVSPELRYVWGGPARLSGKYREASVGISAGWRF